MEDMFGSCISLTALDLSHFDTSNVTDMEDMFGGCWSLTALDLSNFNTSNVKEMAGMFYGCSGLVEVAIGEKFTQLPEQAFAQSDKITSFTALMKQPFAINSNCFTDNVKANATLNVPKGTKATYESTEGWKIFKHISDISNLEPIAEGAASIKVEYGSTSMTIDLNEKPQFVTQNGSIIFKTNSTSVTISLPCKAKIIDNSSSDIHDVIYVKNNNDNAELKVFSLDGRRVAVLKDKSKSVSLRPGIYIINGKKIIIK